MKANRCKSLVFGSSDSAQLRHHVTIPRHTLNATSLGWDNRVQLQLAASVGASKPDSTAPRCPAQRWLTSCQRAVGLISVLAALGDQRAFDQSRDSAQDRRAGTQSPAPAIYRIIREALAKESKQKKRCFLLERGSKEQRQGMGV